MDITKVINARHCNKFEIVLHYKKDLLFAMKLFQRLQNAIKKISFFYDKSLSSKIALRKWHLKNLINWSKHSILFLLSIGVRWFKFQIFIMTHSFQAAQFQVKHFHRLQNGIKKTSFFYDKSLLSKIALRKWHSENLINWSKHSILFLLSIGVRWFKFQIFIMTHSFQAAQFQVNSDKSINGTVFSN